VASSSEQQDQAEDLSLQHKLKASEEAARAQKQAEEAWKASPESKVPWWERKAALIENEARAAMNADVSGVQRNPLIASSLDLPVAVQAGGDSSAAAAAAGVSFARAPFPNEGRTVEGHTTAPPPAVHHHHARFQQVTVLDVTQPGLASLVCVSWAVLVMWC